MITEYIEYPGIKNCLISINRICVNTDNIIKINNSYSYLIKCRITAESAVHIIILSCFQTFIIRIFCCNKNRFILYNRSLSCNYRLLVYIFKSFKCTDYGHRNYNCSNRKLSCWIFIYEPEKWLKLSVKKDFPMVISFFNLIKH